MSYCFTIVSGSLLEMLSEILDTPELWHTVGLEFTPIREQNSFIGFQINIQCLIAEHLKEQDKGISPKLKKILKSVSNME